MSFECGNLREVVLAWGRTTDGKREKLRKKQIKRRGRPGEELRPISSMLIHLREKGDGEFEGDEKQEKIKNKLPVGLGSPPEKKLQGWNWFTN